MNADSAQLLAKVLDALSATTAAGTARLRHGARRDGEPGPLTPDDQAGEGVIDFRQRRAWLSARRIGSGVHTLGEELWDGPHLFLHKGPGEGWMPTPMPFVGAAPGAIPWISPYWLLDALCGARENAQLLEGSSSTDGAMHVRVTIDKAMAVERSTHSLDFPPGRPPVDAFPAHVWLDEKGRIERMACTCPVKPRRWLPKRLVPREHWLVNEFWDFGTPATIPTPPASN